MDIDLYQRHADKKAEQSAPRVLLVVSLLVLVLASGWLAGRHVIAPREPAVPGDRYLGSVQLAPDQQGLCEQFELDNRVGMLRPKGAARCSDVTASTPSSATDAAPTGAGRIRSISEYFKSK